MSITSEPGSGTQVTIRLPAVVSELSIEQNARLQAAGKRQSAAENTAQPSTQPSG
jgi:chemotaxis protein histidine kinase CheA